MNKSEIVWNIIKSYFRDNEDFAVKHHISSYNNFIINGIPQILKESNPLRIIKNLDEDVKDYRYKMELYIGGRDGELIYFGKPIIYDHKNQHYMFPNEARLRNLSYGVTIHYDVVVDFEILLDNEDEETMALEKYKLHKETITLEKVYMGKFPIMLCSNICTVGNLSQEVKFNIGECRSEKGGYFIIDGKEKVIVSQEKFADNMLYIKKNKEDNKYSYAAEIRSVSEDASKPIRTLSVRIEEENGTYKNQNIVVNIPNIRKPVPLFILMRALGVISDYDIIETCLLDMDKNKFFIELFKPSVYDAGFIFTKEAALKYLATLTKGKTIQSVQEILMIYFLPHVGEFNFREKSLFLGYIVFRLLRVYAGVEKPTDRDSYRFKRLETPGILLYQLFREYYILQKRDIILKIDKEYTFKGQGMKYKDLHFKNLLEDNVLKIFKNKIVEQGFKKAFKGNWGSEAHTKRSGVVQDLNRLSYFGSLCHMRKVNLPLDKSAKIVAPRLLHPTQWGIICPIHTPDGGNCGLHKHLSISNTITSGCSGKPYIKYLRNLGMLLLSESSNDYISKTTKIFLNGNWIGTTKEPKNLVDLMRLHRRNNIVDTFTSVFWNILLNEIFISTDGGRPCHPIAILKDGEEMYLEERYKSIIESKEITWDKLILGLKDDNGTLNDCSINVDIEDIDKDMEKLGKTAACIEYLDTSECEGIVLKKKNNPNPRSTHCEIHPSLILSIMANQIIFPENNPFPRNAFSCGQGKQGVSMYHTNFHNRIDKTSYVLNYGQIPLVKSRYLDLVSKEKHPYGENAIVAIACYSGFNVEDAVIVNRASLERGLFRTTYYNMYDAHEEKQNIGGAKIDTRFMSIMENNVIGLKPGYDYSNLDPKTGLIKENVRVTDKVVVIGKTTNSLLDSGLYVDMSKATKKGQIGFVDKSFITNNVEGERLAKVRIREERIPEMGDKFCSRAGQKGTIGIVLDECDMPFTKEGLRPDIIVNPHAMPSRMTIGHLVETLIGKACVMKGGFGDCTAFLSEGPKDKIFGNMLTQEGFHSTGNEYLYNGMTGEQMETEIYFGPTYYLRLKHMPKDKINFRAKGPRSNLTRQTVGGRANDGGLRIGEMDRDCLIAHGVSHFINESMLVRGDQFYMAICNNSGCIAIYNESKNIFLSPQVDGPLKFSGDLETTANIVPISKYGRDFSIVKVPYAFKLLLQELKTMNIQMRIITEDNVDQLMSLVDGKQLEKNTDFNNFTDLSSKISEIITKEKKRKTILDDDYNIGEYEQPNWELTSDVKGVTPSSTKIYKISDFTKGQTIYIKYDIMLGRKWNIIFIKEEENVVWATSRQNGDLRLGEPYTVNDVKMFDVSNITPNPPFKSLKEPSIGSEEFASTKENAVMEISPERKILQMEQREKLTIENINIGDIVYFENDLNNPPNEWKVMKIFGDEGEVELYEMVADWDDSTPRTENASIEELYKEKEGSEWVPQSPTYGPQSPTYAPNSPSYGPNAPTNSPSFDEAEKPIIRTNLIRKYKPDGEYTDKDGKKYTLQKKDNLMEEVDDILKVKEEGENTDDESDNKDGSVKKKIKIDN